MKLLLLLLLLQVVIVACCVVYLCRYFDLCPWLQPLLSPSYNTQTHKTTQ